MTPPRFESEAGQPELKGECGEERLEKYSVRGEWSMQAPWRCEWQGNSLPSAASGLVSQHLDLSNGWTNVGSRPGWAVLTDAVGGAWLHGIYLSVILVLS